MDIAIATPTAERVVKLRNQLAALDVAKLKTESKLAEEHATLRRVASKRGVLIESLNEANEAVSRRAHKELDECDSAIRIGERMTEGLQKVLTKTVQETEALLGELTQVEQAIAAEARAEALRAFEVQLKQARRSAEENLAAARKSLAEFNTLGARGIEKFGNSALMICSPVFEQFVLQESNLDQAGWRPVFPQYTRLEFWIRPMVKA